MVKSHAVNSHDSHIVKDPKHRNWSIPNSIPNNSEGYAKKKRKKQ